MKVLVLGSKGMAGHQVVKHLTKSGHTVHTLARDHATYEMDVEDMAGVQQLMENVAHGYDYIINCIGLLVADCNARPDRAVIINSWFPRMLEQVTTNTDTRVVHISTDCVFNGSQGNYTESDIPTETNVYGRSKSLGEIINSKDITFRTSIIGPELKESGTGLFHWFANHSPSRVEGWTNAIWSGVTTLQLAKCIEIYIENPVISGLYHLTNNANISKFNLICLFEDKINTGKTIVRSQGPKTIDKSLLDTRQDIDFQIPSYKTMIAEMEL